MTNIVFKLHSKHVHGGFVAGAPSTPSPLPQEVRGLRRAFSEAFGVSEEALVAKADRKYYGYIEVTATAVQFSKFIILRNRYGAKNWIQELDASFVEQPKDEGVKWDVTGQSIGRWWQETNPTRYADFVRRYGTREGTKTFNASLAEYNRQARNSSLWMTPPDWMPGLDEQVLNRLHRKRELHYDLVSNPELDPWKRSLDAARKEGFEAGKKVAQDALVESKAQVRDQAFKEVVNKVSVQSGLMPIGRRAFIRWAESHIRLPEELPAYKRAGTPSKVLHACYTNPEWMRANIGDGAFEIKYEGTYAEARFVGKVRKFLALRRLNGPSRTTWYKSTELDWTTARLPAL